mmetsp:Transcript_23262/g.57278  ORF Transcript_23262/g.57278 Transcript_23262/m.57278 type:complete len:84 (-) Transcript_23262:339-590(-)
MHHCHTKKDWELFLVSTLVSYLQDEGSSSSDLANATSFSGEDSFLNDVLTFISRLYDPAPLPLQYSNLQLDRRFMGGVVFWAS